MSFLTRLTRTVVRMAAPRLVGELEQLRGLRLVPATRAAAPAVAVEPPAAEIPSIDAIQAAARLHDQAREQANAAARTKRKAEKVLARTPDGTYGPVTIERVPSGRQTADLDAIRAIFAANGLGELPMRACSPSLVITWAAEESTDVDTAALVAA
ncbi:hypothetical protein [Microbispora sp. CSR-4]|uniref:hypothetical protein n=1 Tax=Microbispora sp. CSR-4 TaxID=2592813 RepID=UPI001C9D1893|nr:hypothetical protein [Microbispora sp. CSR-4]